MGISPVMGGNNRQKCYCFRGKKTKLKLLYFFLIFFIIIALPCLTSKSFLFPTRTMTMAGLASVLASVNQFARLLNDSLELISYTSSAPAAPLNIHIMNNLLVSIIIKKEKIWTLFKWTLKMACKIIIWLSETILIIVQLII